MVHDFKIFIYSDSTKELLKQHTVNELKEKISFKSQGRI